MTTLFRIGESPRDFYTALEFSFLPKSTFHRSPVHLLKTFPSRGDESHVHFPLSKSAQSTGAATVRRLECRFTGPRDGLP